MAGINKVIIVGRVGNDPETRRFQSGDEMAEFSVATSDQWKDKNTGERKERVEWHKVKIMNPGLVKNVVRPFVNKGSLVGIEGELQTEKWKDRDNNDRYTTRVVVSAFKGTIYLLGNKDDSSGSRSGGGDDRRESNRSSSGSRGGSSSGGGYSTHLDDDIPFAPEWRG